MVFKFIDTCPTLFHRKKQACILCLPSSVVLSVQERTIYNTRHDRSDHVHFHKNPISLSNTFVSHVTIHIKSVPPFKNTTIHVCVCVF